MKKIFFRLFALAVLISTGCFLYANAPKSVTSCWEKAYNTWTACDNAYSNTKYQYITKDEYCSSNSETTCSASANSFCSSQASTSCANDPNPQQCYNNAYNNCYLSKYQTCQTQTQIECLNNVQSSYDNRGSAYGSCLGIEGNYGNCIEQMEFSCADAANRASSCFSLYSDSGDYDAYVTCRANSGVDSCQ